MNLKKLPLIGFIILILSVIVLSIRLYSVSTKSLKLTNELETKDLEFKKSIKDDNVYHYDIVMSSVKTALRLKQEYMLWAEVRKLYPKQHRKKIDSISLKFDSLIVDQIHKEVFKLKDTSYIDSLR